MGFQPEDSNSKIFGNQADPTGEETTDSISSMLRKEIEGKVVISKPLTQTNQHEPKDSFDESFMDAKEELLSATSLEAASKTPLLPQDPARNLLSMEIDKAPSGRKRKNMDSEGKSISPKLPS